MHLAMLRARLAVARTPGGQGIWVAYQHYGNPNYRILSARGGNGSRRAGTSFHHAQQKHVSRNRPSSSVNTNFSPVQEHAVDPPADFQPIGTGVKMDVTGLRGPGLRQDILDNVGGIPWAGWVQAPEILS